MPELVHAVRDGSAGGTTFFEAVARIRAKLGDDYLYTGPIAAQPDAEIMILIERALILIERARYWFLEDRMAADGETEGAQLMDDLRAALEAEHLSRKQAECERDAAFQKGRTAFLEDAMNAAEIVRELESGSGSQ